MNVYEILKAVLECDDNPKSPHTCHLNYSSSSVAQRGSLRGSRLSLFSSTGAICLCKGGGFYALFFRWIQCDGINWEKWLKPDTQGSWGNRQTEGPREEGVKPQFLYVVWFQFGKSHHSPVHWGGKPDECVPVCCQIERFSFFLLVLHTCCRKPLRLLIHPDTSTSSFFFNVHCLEASEIEGHAQFSAFAAEWAQKIDTALVSKSVTN